MVLGRTRLASPPWHAPRRPWGLGSRTGGRDQAKAALLLRTMKGLDVHEVEISGAAIRPPAGVRSSTDVGVRLTAHRDRGHRVVLVAASLTAYLGPFSAEMGFDDVIATRLEVGSDGRPTAVLAGRNVRVPEKAVHLRALLGT
jgi:phosphoserine phosphatase